MGYKLLFLAAFVAALAAPAAAQERNAGGAPVLEALLTIGAPYRLGGSSPETGFDCSGLVAHVFRRAWGMAMPRSVQAQSFVGKVIPRRHELEPGDLVFFNTRNRPYSHVGIYVGAGQFIHAPRPGRLVRIEAVDKPYWRARFNGARRLAPAQPEG
jgi:cell wall-associated NlpC family hydrolase